jgi:hypothetical protein
VPRSLLIIAAGAFSLAAGCCCPALSGRYYEAGLEPPLAPVAGDVNEAAGKCANDACGGFARHSHDRLRPGWLSRGRHEPVPSQQQYDYLSPLPKFHPAPTHPVFEAQAHYLPPSDPAPLPRGMASGTHGK